MESPQQAVDVSQRYRMSWTAYVRPTIVFLIMFCIGFILNIANGWVGGTFMAFWLGLFIVQALTIRSVVLYTNDQGVWVYSGIFPWSKGMRGVKWRDIEDAVYFPNFLSWALNSYTVRIGHRFTKSSEIVLPNIARGHEAVIHINEFHHNVLAANPRGSIA